ncbi:unnamed protein product [Rotaria sp. Silwood2]|nr:unnamed protein product [Rotaria sp. Silwood2]CAF3028035.1 unnamed protein product [Rotaria sp. Silwood2]CAF3347472.1 unnamed protein product [Rotaria sp. Silwood2]CAF4188078.1 unnamed protein product [Rotaria sp. Silwood2]CAF4411527.1 unnamed protein product [Rotaria sp. Silwood2]
MKVTKSNLIDDIEIQHEPLSIGSNETKININPMTIILANGKLLLTNFEEKYLIDVILKTSNKDIEII